MIRHALALVPGLVIAGVASGFVLLILIRSPAVYSDPTVTFTNRDRLLLEMELPGGRYISERTYSRCESNGRVVWYHADGTITWVGTYCWDWRRRPRD